MGLRTIVLKLNKPSQCKRQMMDEAIFNYNRAYRFLLERAYVDLKEIKDTLIGDRSNQNALALSKWVGKELSTELNQFDVQPFKDALKLEVGMALAGYFRLKAVRPGTGFPLSNNKGGSEIEKLRPVYFCRYDTKRSYCLLHDSVKNRYYVKLHLLNGKNAKAVAAQADRTEKLIYIHSSYAKVESGKRREAFIIVPLSFGKYQEEILKAAMEKPEILRTAKLSKKNGEYYLAVSVDTGKTEEIKTDTFLGVARGLKDDLCYTVADAEGKAVDTGSISRPTQASLKSTVSLDELHKAANSIADIALKNRSQVIVQNLLEKGDRLNWADDFADSQPAYKCEAYIRLTRLLEFKLPEKGLPPPVRVSSVDIFYRCHACGFYSRQNRFSKDTFICTSCGATLEIEKLGSLNLARKLINYGHSTIKVKVLNTAEGVWFTNRLIGLNYFVPYTENQIEKLREKIRSIIEEIKHDKDAWGKERNKKASIAKKIDSAEDFMRLIEFV